MNRISTLLAQRYPYFADLLTVRLRLTLVTVALLVLAVQLSAYGATIGRSENLITPQGPVIGGDFVVFHTAASAVGDPDMSAVYDPPVLSDRLKQAFPGGGDFLLSFQYPPTGFLLFSPFGLMPYLVGFIVWVAIGGGALATVSRKIWPDPVTLLLIIAAPASFQAMITGQTGFITATLIAIAALNADKRPLVAGIAAGLLTFKPQLGLLIPIAFAAAGCWRAFAVAALTAVSFAGASVLAFGFEPWLHFIEAVRGHGAQMDDAIFPVNKLVSFYGGASMIGAASIGIALQAMASITIAAFVFFVWRREKSADIRLAVLASSALLVTPYAFYYELAVLAPVMVVLARRGVKSGWLAGERFALAFVWLAPMMLPGADAPAFPLAFAVVFTTFLLAARRALVEMGFTFASAAQPAQAGS